MEQQLVMVVYTTEKQTNDETCNGFGKGWILQHFYFFNPPLSVSVELSKRIVAHIIQGSR